ncbi:hypothetical protein CLFO_35300 [Clostridium formicaceticum]|uniref:Mobile element protein CD1107-like domain-containing protein n=2 Tax=Clostridium formicaceticum TaxID=1497 RepID=A0AAC9RNT7_9CLOT|nr:hypothetical protein BJL90_01470 [Clostridium formicaceticum]ARE89124.1 hypothetical protein CLFO_35300 [Clostridium formicaceticum]
MKIFRTFLLLVFVISMMTTSVLANTVNDDTLLEKTMPESVTGEKRDGSGTAVDYTFSGEKEFYTIVTADGNTYYLVIDNEKSQDNVYFLKEINDGNLSVNKNVPVTELEQIPQVPTPIETPSDTESGPKGNNNLLLIAIVFVILIGAGYYFKIYKPKQKKLHTPSQEDGYDEEYEELQYIEDDEDIIESDTEGKGE